MYYTIGQVAEMFNMPISTLRYYDKEGLFPDLVRTSGIRRFGERELEALRVIECLKRSGLEIKDIKQFMQWCGEGSSTYPQRRELFLRQKQTVEAEIARFKPGIETMLPQLTRLFRGREREALADNCGELCKLGLPMDGVAP